MNLAQLTAAYIEGVYQTKALLIKEQTFVLQSGKKSNVYLNHRNFLTQHQYLSLIVDIYHQLATSVFGQYVLGVVDSVMSPIIAGAMSTRYGHDIAVIKQIPMAHGTKEDIYGDVKNPILLVDDMTSTGDTLIKAAEKIRAADGTVNYAIISAYRDTTAIENLAAHDITLLGIASFEQVITTLYPDLTPTEQSILQNNPLIFA